MLWIEQTEGGWTLYRGTSFEVGSSQRWTVETPEELGRLIVELTSRGSDHGIDLDAGGG